MRKKNLDRVRQHYVWRNYLTAWAKEDETLACRNYDGKIFRVNPRNIAVERYFYRAEELTPLELAFIKKAFIEGQPLPMQKIGHEWLAMFNAPFKFLKQLRAKETEDKVKAIDEAMILIENNLIEEIHGRIEKMVFPYLPHLKNKDSTFYYNIEHRMDFLTFLSVQYVRTNKIRSNVMSSLSKTTAAGFNVDLEKIWNPMAHIFSLNLAYQVAKDEAFKLIFLDNQTDISFLTGDQPVVNLHATDKAKGEQIDSLELYYPLSPKLAILISESKKYEGRNHVLVSELEVKEFNRHILENSLKQVFALEEDELI